MDSEVVNPLLEFRLAQDSGRSWSLDRTSREFGISASTIIRTEQGCYADIPPAILRRLTTYFVSADSVRDQYYRYQTRKRMSVRDHRTVERFFTPYLKSLIERHPEVNPFFLFRCEIIHYKSRLAFCKDLCLHPSTVKRVEDGVAEKLPESIRRVLIDDLWLDVNAIDDLDSDYQKWRENVRRHDS